MVDSDMEHLQIILVAMKIIKEDKMPTRYAEWPNNSVAHTQQKQEMRFTIQWVKFLAYICHKNM